MQHYAIAEAGTHVPVIMFSDNVVPEPPPLTPPSIIEPEEEKPSFKWASTNPSEQTVLTDCVHEENERNTDNSADIPEPIQKLDDYCDAVEDTIATEEILPQESPNTLATEEIKNIEELSSASTIIQANNVQNDAERVVSKNSVGKQKRRRRFVAPVSQKSQQIMKNLASSFLHEARDYRKHVVTIIGDPHAMPTEEQIKQERYLARLQQCIYTSFMTMRSRAPFRPELQENSLISIRVQRDGSVSAINIEKTSNDPLLDQFYISVFLDASRSFPPLPSYFPLSFYIFRWFMVVKPE